jgi:hypothetical protein
MEMEVNMFDFLSDVTSDQAVGGVYYAMRLIKHRESIRETKNGRSIDALLADSSPDEREMALKIIKEIERLEKLPFTSLNKPRVEKYINQVGDIVLERVASELDDKAIKKGQRTLAKWRQADPLKLRYSPKPSARRSR